MEAAAMPTDVCIPLEQVRIATPCSMRWEDMAGDDKRRFCDACRLHVHNLGAMSDSEVQDLLTSAAEGRGRVCARLFQRTDGTVLLQDCPVGLRAAAIRMARGGVRIAACVVMLLGLGTIMGASRSSRLASLEPFRWLAARLNPAPAPAPPPMGRILLGDVCVAPAPVPVPARGQGAN